MVALLLFFSSVITILILATESISVFGHLDINWAKNFSFGALVGQLTYL